MARVHTGEELGRASRGEIIQQSHFWSLVLSITCSEFLRSSAPAGRGHTGEDLGAVPATAVRGRLIGAQVAEGGRYCSGAVKTTHKRGPTFRASNSGYSLRQHPRLIPIRRLLSLARLGLYLSERITGVSESKSKPKPKKHSQKLGQEKTAAGQSKWDGKRKGM